MHCIRHWRIGRIRTQTTCKNEHKDEQISSVIIFWNNHWSNCQCLSSGYLNPSHIPSICSLFIEGLWLQWYWRSVSISITGSYNLAVPYALQATAWCEGWALVLKQTVLLLTFGVISLNALKLLVSVRHFCSCSFKKKNLKKPPNIYIILIFLNRMARDQTVFSCRENRDV